MPKIEDIPDKFKFQEDYEQGRKVWYVIEKPNEVIATCYDAKNAER